MTLGGMLKDFSDKKEKAREKKHEEFLKKEKEKKIKEIKEEISHYETQLSWINDLERDYKAGKLDKEFSLGISYIPGFIKNYKRNMKRELDDWKAKLAEETVLK